MPLSFLFPDAPADIRKLTEARDIPALIRLLGGTDPEQRTRASDALISFGSPADPAFFSALGSGKARIRLGVIEILGQIADPAAIPVLVQHLHQEKHVELKYAITIALGETGLPQAIPPLFSLLGDQNSYVRYGAATSLDRLGWEHSDEEGRIMYLVAIQDWDAVRAAGPAAVPRLQVFSRDPDPAIRSRIAKLLGQIGDRSATPTCEIGLRDHDPQVRWAAVLAAMDCGIRPARLPPFIANRERTGPDPVAAAILNFLFLGTGYNYIGKWWGLPVFMTYMTLIVLAQLAVGPFIPYLIAFPITAIIGVHTYYMTRRMSDL